MLFINLFFLSLFFTISLQFERIRIEEDNDDEIINNKTTTIINNKSNKTSTNLVGNLFGKTAKEPYVGIRIRFNEPFFEETARLFCKFFFIKKM